MRSDREIISSEITSLTQLADHLTKVCGFVVPVSSANSAKKMTGVLLRKPKSRKGSKLQNSRIIAKALIHLYKELGRTIPDQLIEVARRLEGNGSFPLSYSEEEKEGNEQQ